MKFSFVHLDGDLYQTTADALDWFWPRMVPGGVIILDDVDWPKCPGVNRALEERGLLTHVERTAAQQGRLVKKATAPVVSFTMKVNGGPVEVVQPAQDEWEGVSKAYKTLKAGKPTA